MADGNIGAIWYTVEADTSKLLSSVTPADQSLDRLQKTFDRTDKAANQANFRLTKTAAAVKGLGRETSVASEAMNQMQRILVGLLSIRTATALIQMAEGYNEMAERIRMATAGVREYNMVQARLLENANSTYRSLSEAQEVYIRTADSLRSMGYSTSEVLDITDSLSYLFVTNAASADRASTAISAYSKAINKGKVEADAWESILAATPSIINDIANASGLSAAKVRELGASGKLTAQQLNEGLRKSLESNKAAAADMQVTVRDATTAMRNNLTVFLGKVNEATGVTGGLAAQIDRVAQAIQNADVNEFVRELDALGDTLSMIGDGFQGMFDLITAVAGETGGKVGKSFQEMALATAKEVDGIGNVFKGTAGAAQAVYEALAKNIPNFFSNAYNSVLQDAASFVNRLGDLINKPLQAMGMEGVGKVSFGAGSQREIVSLTDAAREGWEKATSAAGYYDQMLQDIEDREFLRAVSGWAEAYEGDINEATNAAKGLLKETGKGDKALRRAMEANKKVIDGLAESLYQAGLSGEALAVAKARASLNDFATPEQVAQVENMARALYKVQEAMTAREKFGTGAKADEYIMGKTDPLSGGMFDEQYARYEAEAQAEQERYAAQLERLKQARELQIETKRSYDQLEQDAAQQHANRMAQIEQAKNSVILSSASDAFGAMADIMRQSQGEQSSIYRAMFAASKAFAVADATINAYSAISKAWNSAPFPANLAAVAATAPQVMSLVSAISGASYSGRQYGGPVAPGRMYRINENGAPEVYNAANGQQFLLPNTRGQVVSNKDASSGSDAARPILTINLIEDASRGGQIDQSAGPDGEEFLDVFVANIRSGGRAAQVIEGTYGVRRQGR